jgi:hypothetical protein
MKNALYSINQLNHQILLPKTTAIADSPPKFDDFRFNTIGQQPQLLKRFTAPDTQRQQYLSLTPSPNREVQPLPPMSETTPLSIPKARLTLLEALADGITTSKDILTDAPVVQRQNMPTKGVVSIGNPPARLALPVASSVTDKISSPSTQQEPVPTNISDTLSTRPTMVVAAAALPEMSHSPLSSSAQPAIPPVRLHPTTIQTSGPIDSTSVRSTLQNIHSRLRNSLTTLNAVSSPIPSPTLTSVPAPTLSEILQHVHRAAQLSVSNVSSCLLSAQAAHTLAQQSMHASEHSLALVQQSLTAAQDAHDAANRSSAEAQLSLNGAREARENAEELLRVIGRMEVAIRSRERDIELREEKVRREVFNTRTAVEVLEALVAEEGARDEEQRLKVERSRVEGDRRDPEMGNLRTAEAEADIARKAWDRLSEREDDERMQIDQNPSVQPVNPEVARPSSSARPQPDTSAPAVSSIQPADQRADYVHRESETSNGSRPREPPEALAQARRDTKAREEEVQRQREKEEEGRARLLQEKMRAAVQSDKIRFTQEAAAKIQMEREAKLKKTLGDNSPGTSPMKGVVFGNPVSNKVLLPSSPDIQTPIKPKPVYDNAKLGAGNPSSNPSTSPNYVPIATPALPLTPVRQSAITPTSHQHQLPKKPMVVPNVDSSKAFTSHKFVPAATDIGRQVNTEAPLSSIALASETRQNPDGASTNVSDNTNGAVQDAPPPSLPPQLPLLDPSPQNTSGDNVSSAPLKLPASRPPPNPSSSPMNISPTVSVFKRSDSELESNIEMGCEPRRLEIGATPPSSSYAEQVSNLRHLASESGVKIEVKLEPKVKKEPGDEPAAVAPMPRKVNGTAIIPDVKSGAVPPTAQPSSLVSPSLGGSAVPTANPTTTDTSNSAIAPARRMKLPSISNLSKSRNTVLDKTPTDGVINGENPPIEGNQLVSSATVVRQVNGTTRDNSRPTDHDKRQGSSGNDGRKEERNHQQVTPGGTYPARRPLRRSPTPNTGDYYESPMSRTRRNVIPPRSPPLLTRREFTDHYSPPRSLGPSRHPLPPIPTISNRKRVREDSGPTSHSELHPSRRQRQEDAEINRGRTASQRLDNSRSYRPSQETTLARRLQSETSLWKADSYVPSYSDGEPITFSPGEAERYLSPAAQPSAPWGSRDVESESPLFLPRSPSTETEEQQPGLLGRMTDRTQLLPSQSARAANSNRRVSERIRGGPGKGRGGGMGRGNTRDLASRLAAPLRDRLD